MFEDFKTLLVEQMNIDEADITPDAELVADLGINSLELADLVFSCESKYNIEIDEEDYIISYRWRVSIAAHRATSSGSSLVR